MRSSTRWIFGAFAMLFALAPVLTFVLPLRATSQPACVLYAVHDEGIRDSQLITVDVAGGVVTALGPLHRRVDLEGLDFNPTTLELVASGGMDGREPSRLYQVDDTNGAISEVGVIRDANGTPFYEVASLSFRPDGGLWGFASEGDPAMRGILQIDPATAEAQVAVTSTLDVEALAWTPDGTTLWMAVRKQLYRWTPGTPVEAGPAFPDLSGPIEGLEFRQDGVLVATLHNAGAVRLYMLDVRAGAVLDVLDYDSPLYYDIESLAWPEPCEFPGMTPTPAPTATPTSTSTAVPPTATPTSTPVPPTATATPTPEEPPNGDTPTPTPTLTSTPTLTPTFTPTSTPSPTPTPTPTATAAPPTATPTPTPTPTPTATVVIGGPVVQHIIYLPIITTNDPVSPAVCESIPWGCRR